MAKYDQGVLRQEQYFPLFDFSHDIKNKFHRITLQLDLISKQNKSVKIFKYNFYVQITLSTAINPSGKIFKISTQQKKNWNTIF